jgi:hypothetical protein
MGVVTAGRAQDAAAEEPVPFAPTLLTPDQLDQLLGPIALYPDALIALILPAATVPADIVLAARHVRSHPNDLSQIEHRAWDDSVKSLARYPDVLKWMDDNLAWTKQVGEAFLEQPAEVMKSIQRLRVRAHAAGTLVDTPQQQVVVEPPILRIIPAQPDVIYVPRYDPAVVFIDRPIYYVPRPVVTFGLGYRVGPWLAYDCDWARHSIWIGDRHRHWVRHDWRRPLVAIPPPHVHIPAHGYVGSRTIRVWQPPPRPPRPTYATVQPRHHVAPPSLPRPPPLKLTPVQPGQSSTVLPPLPSPTLPATQHGRTHLVPGGPAHPRSQPPAATHNWGRREADPSRGHAAAPARRLDRPASTPNALPSAPPLPLAGALTQTPATVVAPPQPAARGSSRIHSLPQAPRLQLNGPVSSATPATVTAPAPHRSYQRPAATTSGSHRSARAPSGTAAYSPPAPAPASPPAAVPAGVPPPPSRNAGPPLLHRERRPLVD